MAPARGIRAPPGTCSSFLFIYFFIHVSHNDKKDERKLLNWIYTSINQNGSNLMFHAFLAFFSLPEPKARHQSSSVCQHFQTTSLKSWSRFLPYWYLPPKGRGTYCCWCGSCWCHRSRDTFLFPRYLMNRCVDFKYICMGVTLGHDEELIRFWWPWYNFQGHCRT